MKIKTNSRQHRASAEQRIQMVEKFRRNGLSRAVFSQQYGIPKSTLNWWLKQKAKRSARLPVSVPFHEIKLAAPAASAGLTWTMEVVAPSGLIILCREEIPIHNLKSW
jgi:transposase-like protein